MSTGPPAAVTHEVTAVFGSRSRQDFQAWLAARSAEAVRAARLVLETLAATLTGLTVWATPGEAGYTAAQVRSLLAGAVLPFPQAAIDRYFDRARRVAAGPVAQSTVCRQVKHNSLFVDTGRAPELPAGTWVVACASGGQPCTPLQVPGGGI